MAPPLLLLKDIRLTFGRAKGGEVVVADEFLRGRVHRLGVERLCDPPGVLALEREIGAAVDDAIKIMPLSRREARVEIVRYLLGR